MNNKTVMITGAGRGIGEAAAKAFLEEGYHVIAAGRTVPGWEVPARLEAALERIALDVTDEKAVDEAVKRAADSCHPIRVLVNNAGIATGAPIAKMSTDMWKTNFRVNTDGTFFCTRAVVRVLQEKNLSGSIINIASIAGKIAFADTCAYCAAKAAVIGMTRGLAVELGPYDISVNAICPGSVDTRMIKGVIDDIAGTTGDSREAVRRRMEFSIPMRRFQSPEDVAALAVFLGSEKARNINGEAINLDGGVTRD